MAAAPTDPDFRPLLTAPPRQTEGGVELDVAERTLRVEGDPAEVTAVLGLCDGRLTVAEIADGTGIEPEEVSGLLATLAEEGGVVDAADAWRMFHRLSAVDSGLMRSVDQTQVEAIQAETFAPAEPPQQTVALEPARTEIDGLTARRRSSWPDDPPREATFAELSAVLERMYGCGDPVGRPVPSGGALYPLVLHMVLRGRSGPAEAGVWWYDPAHGCIRLLRAGRFELEPLFVPIPNTIEHLSRGGPVVFISADVGRAARKYGPRAYRLALIECGAAMQNAYLVAAGLDVPVRAMLGLSDPPAVELLGLPDGTVPLLAIFLGL